MINSTGMVPICLQNPDPFPFEDFAPTLAQCFLIVIIGYLVAKFQLLSAADLRGVNAFVIYVGMPGIICMTLADAELGDLRWELLLGLFLGKCFIFALVSGVSFWVNGNIGIAGLLAIYCVHSNDLPVGNPVMSALYKNHRPEMMKYLFMMPAMTMVFFIPVGNFMLEVYKTQRLQNVAAGQWNHRALKWSEVVTKKEVLTIFRSLIKSSPVIIASVTGVILNFSFKGQMPLVLHKPLQVVAATVPGCVLSILGFNMVRKERYLITSAVVTATVLLVVKLLVTPIVMHTITRLLTGGDAASKPLSDFAFLYGIVSPATAIFLSGQEFRKPLAAMSAALITTSFLSFPLSYVVARFTIPTNCKLSHYVPTLKTYLFWVASFSMLCNIIVLITTILKKKWNKVPYCYVMCLVFTQMLTASGILVWNLSDEEPWSVYCQMALYYGGEISGFIWIGTIAVILISADRCPSLAQNAFSIISFTTFAACGVITTVMWVLISYNDIKKVYVVGRARSNFEFLQLAAGTTLQIVCVMVVAVCLLLHFKRQHLSDVLKKRKARFEYDNPIFYTGTEQVTTTHYKKKRASCASILTVQMEREEADLYYQEVLHNGGCDKVSTIGPEWTFRFFSLLMLLLIAILVKLISNMYKLAASKALEIMIPLEFLQSTLFIGQGFFTLLTFGIDARTISIRLTNWWRRARYGKEEFVHEIPEKYEESEGDMFCGQFHKFYFNKCFQNLAKDRKWKDNFYKDCFWGHQLIDWLIQEGVAKDDLEAEELGQKLLLGGVIGHVTGSHHFHDAPYLYYFLKRERRPCSALPEIVEEYCVPETPYEYKKVTRLS